MSSVDFVPTPKFEEYKERFKQHYKLERREDGVILVQAHTGGGPIQLSVESHRSVGQLFKTIGADPENEVMIFTGTGEDFMMDADPEGFKLKRIEVAPGARLSLQSHKHRSEHWVVVAGVATVTNGDEIITVNKNQSTYIPMGTKHRLENRGAESLHIVEIQVGEYLGEDDIQRYEDNYGR